MIGLIIGLVIEVKNKEDSNQNGYMPSSVPIFRVHAHIPYLFTALLIL